MISWASKKLLNASLAIAFLAALTTVGLFSTPVSADAITGKNNDGLASKTERWLRLRAVTRCFDVNDVGKNSYNDVNNGAIFDSGSAAIGYLNPDGKVSCDGDGGEAFVRNSFNIIGFANPVSAFCSVQPMASRGSSDTKSTDNYNGCVNGSGDEFDMDSNAFDQGARQVLEFKEGYKKYATAPVPWSPTPEMMYYVYRQSLVEFCGAKLIGKYDPADKNNIDADKRKVVVNDVDLGTGEIIRNVYSLNRDQGDKVDDIYVNGDLQNVSNVTCSTMAQKTWDYDEDMSAYVKTYNTANPDDVGAGTVDGTNPNGSLEPVCSAGALGWIFCPLTEFISDATKMVAEVLEERLIYPALTTSDQGKVIRTIWGTVLGIANVGLVIAFLIVIFSQATSVGLSSYGIKKILPRVVAAAILMNLSFFICAIAVDFANILGVSIKAIIENGIKSLPNSGVSEAGYSWSTTLVAILGLGLAVVTGAIALLLPVLVAAFVAVLTAFLVIAAREVLVTLLIIVAPIAFLAWILPNTEQWFTKWRKLFTTMLLMFPLVMLIFYGSLLLSNVILVSADGGADGTPDLMVNVIALGVLTVPLFSLPFIMKSAGGVLDRLGVMVNNRNKGIIDRSRKAGQDMYGARKDTRRMNAFGDGKLNKINPLAANMRRKATRDHRRGLRKGIADENSQEYIAKKALEGGEGRLSYSGRMVNSSNKSYIAAVQASAQATVDKQDRQSIANREVLMRAKYNSEDLIGKAKEEFEVAVRSTDQTGARAAQNILLNSGTPGLDALSSAVNTMEAARAFEGSDKKVELKEGVKKDLNAAGLKPKQNALATWSYDDRPLSDITNDGLTYASLNDNELVGQTADNIGIAVNTGVINAAKAQSLLDNPSLQGALNDKKRAHLQRAISGITPAGGGPTPPATPPPTQPPAGAGPSGGNPSQPSSVQQQRQQGGNFNGGPGQNLPPTNP